MNLATILNELELGLSDKQVKGIAKVFKAAIPASALQKFNRSHLDTLLTAKDALIKLGVR